LKIREYQISQLINKLQANPAEYYYALQQLQDLKSECLAEQVLSSLGEAESKLLIEAVKAKAEEMKAKGRPKWWGPRQR